jgi:hypothetical protein
LYWNVKEKVEVRERGVTTGRTNKQVLEGTNRPLSFDTTRSAQKEKKLGRVRGHRQQGELISLLTGIRGDTQAAM